MPEFQGIYPALITPMTDEQELSEDALRKVIEFNIESGVHGFWVAGGSGESVVLDDEENQRIATIAVDQTAGRAKVIMHVGAAITRRAAVLATHAAKVWVDASCAVPPFFYPVGDQEVTEHYRVIASATSLPFFAYNLPLTNVEITPALAARLQDRVPQFVGLKHSSAAFISVREFVSMGLTCFIGSCRLVLPALTMGAAGCVDGPPGCFPMPYLKIWDAFHRGDLESAATAQDQGTALCELFIRWPYIASAKALMSEQIGVDCGPPRAPTRALTADERVELVAAMREVGALQPTSVA